MPITRYGSRPIQLNVEDKYDDLFKERGVKFINQYTTPNMTYPTVDEIGNLNVISHVWKPGDRYWKLASRYYSNRPELWWIIAWFNQLPTEGNVEIGEIISIPLPLEKILTYLDI